MGGIYDSRLDYYVNTGTVNFVILQSDSFNIQTLPKRKERTALKMCTMKPKIGYRSERGGGRHDDVQATTTQSAAIGGGYGRIFTNYHSLISYESYSMMCELDTSKVAKVEKKNFRVIRLQKPVSLVSIGRYPIGPAGES